MKAASLAGACLVWSCAAKAPLGPLATTSCPPAVLERIRGTDLTIPATDTPLFSSLHTETIACQAEIVRNVAVRLDGASDPSVLDDFCSAAATLARFLPPDVRAEVKAAYARFPYRDRAYLSYFGGLRLNLIDLRSHLRGKVAEDWSFGHPRHNAQTWHYYLYLASLDEPGAYNKLTEKLAATTSGNDVTNLLTSLAELGTAEAKNIVLGYANDQRRADGPNGPAMKIAETVTYLLQMHFSP